VQKVLPDGTLTETRNYDTAGNLTSLTHFNGVTTTYTYDSLNACSAAPRPARQRSALPTPRPANTSHQPPAMAR